MATRRVRWARAWRVIASRYPPIDLFERVSPDPAVWDALILLEQLTNPRLRDEVGDIAMVTPEDRVSGPGASYVMASFTHVNPRGSRFSNGLFSAYYAAAALRTAVAETVHHFEEFARDAGDQARAEDMRVIVGSVDAELVDVEALETAHRDAVLAPNNYAASVSWAVSVRETGALGVVYPSVRDAGGECLAAFKPRAVGLPRQERHLQYRWTGDRVDRVFDYARDAWFFLPLTDPDFEPR